ncbi:MAG: SPFH domain-containing protein [Gammaproteobacteria bacterium]|nr:SPFH domain-containing protein [Gammaproteobacteria bacterium]
MNSKFLPPIMIIAIAIVLLIMSAGINDAGNRTVVQYPTGKLLVKFTPGIYMKWFGTATVYRDVLTYDYDKINDGGTSSMNQQGIDVRYQDGGTGTVYGKARFSLPNDEQTMLALHKAFRSNAGVASKLIKTVTEEGMNLTAGLMSSEAAYTEKRSIFTQWASEQISGGKYQTELKQISTVDESTGKRVVKNIPVITYGDDGRPVHLKSDLKEYGIVVNGFQITDWNFEQKTLNQISTKREATMAIITAKANAERAKQDALTAEEQGKANVMTAKYEKEVEKERAVVMAEQNKEVAVIKAKQLVDVAEQQKLEAEQKKLAAAEYKQEQILRGEGDGEYKRLVMEADGALAQKLMTYEAVMNRFAQAIEKQKWVPEIQMGISSDSSEGGSNAAALIDMLSVKTAKDLALDLSLPK